MKVLFVHDHKFRKIDGEFYSPGGLSNEILSRYTNWFEKVKVVGRVIDEQEVKDSYSRIANKNISVVPNKGLRKRVHEADAVIARLPSINGYAAVFWARFFQKPVLVEVVGCVFDAYWNYSLVGKMVALPAYLVMRWSVSNAPYSLYVTKNFLQRRYPSKGKQSAISDLELSDIDENVIEKRIERIRSKRNKIVLGTIAAVDVPYKGQEYVIRAIPELEKSVGVRIEYQLAGAGDTSHLMKIAEETGVRNQVVFRGIIPHKEIFCWLDMLDVYIHPSMLEGLSRAIMEAMSRGLPCVAADRGGNCELLEKAYLFSAGNKSKISEEIVRVVSSILMGEKMEKCAVRNYQYVNKFYNNKSLDERRNEFYSEFCDSIVGKFE
jgi:glycosyltransferase involved in cell wall biosynthesis